MACALTAVLIAAGCGGVGNTSTVTVTTTAPAPAAAATRAVAVAETKEAVERANANITAALGEQQPTPAIRSISFPKADPNEDVDAQVRDLAKFVALDAADYWRRVFAKRNQKWTPIKVRQIPAGQTATSACRTESGSTALAGDSNENPSYGTMFWCGSDNTVYLSLPYMKREIWLPHVTDAGARKGGDFALAIAVAHEIGHAVQSNLDIKDPPNELTVKPIEMQADCIAGVWASAKFEHGDLDPGDVDEAIESVEDSGDYQVFKRGHHGTPQERRNAFMTGYNAGTARNCTLGLGADDGSAISDLPPGGISVTLAVQGYDTAVEPPTTTSATTETAPPTDATTTPEIGGPQTTTSTP